MPKLATRPVRRHRPRADRSRHVVEIAFFSRDFADFVAPAHDGGGEQSSRKSHREGLELGPSERAVSALKHPSPPGAVVEEQPQTQTERGLTEPDYNSVTPSGLL